MTNAVKHDIQTDPKYMNWNEKQLSQTAAPLAHNSHLERASPRQNLHTRSQTGDLQWGGRLVVRPRAHYDEELTSASYELCSEIRPMTQVTGSKVRVLLHVRRKVQVDDVGRRGYPCRLH